MFVESLQGQHAEKCRLLRVTGLKQLEVSAQAMAAAAALAGRVALYGGAALIMDYGLDAPYPVRALTPVNAIVHLRHGKCIHYCSAEISVQAVCSPLWWCHQPDSVSGSMSFGRLSEPLHVHKPCLAAMSHIVSA